MKTRTGKSSAIVRRDRYAIDGMNTTKCTAEASNPGRGVDAWIGHSLIASSFQAVICSSWRFTCLLGTQKAQSTAAKGSYVVEMKVEDVNCLMVFERW